MRSFEGVACVVTGASGGIGRAVALALVRAGANVWALGRSSELLEALAGEADGSGAVRPLSVDLADDEALAEAARSVLAADDGLAALVHSAGTIRLGSAESLTPTDLDVQYAVNLRAPYALTRLLLPALRRGGGQVLFVNSSAALQASASNALYAATKAGLKGLADGLRQEVNGDGVRVVSVYVGRAATPMQVAVHEFEGRTYRPELLLRPEDVADTIISALTVSSSGEVTDLSIRSMSKPEEPAR